MLCRYSYTVRLYGAAMYVISQVIKTATVLYLVSLPIGMLLGAPKVFMIVGMGVFVTCYSLAGESQSCKPSCRDIWGPCDASMMHWQLQLEGSAQSLQAQYMILPCVQGCALCAGVLEHVQI